MRLRIEHSKLLVSSVRRNGGDLAEILDYELYVHAADGPLSTTFVTAETGKTRSRWCPTSALQGRLLQLLDQLSSDRVRATARDSGDQG